MKYLHVSFIKYSRYIIKTWLYVVDNWGARWKVLCQYTSRARGTHTFNITTYLQDET